MSLVRQFRNKHKGERCFICATGPSLNKVDLSLLDNEITFGVNSFYKTGRLPTYYGISDMHVWFNHRHILRKLDTQFFITGKAHMKFIEAPVEMRRQPVLLPELKHGGFATDIERGLYNGDSVIYDVCMQVAFYMGFENVYIIGLDWDYSGDHHFDGSQVDNHAGGAAGKWQSCIDSFERARYTFQKNGRGLYNATVGGKCDVLKRVQFKSLF